MHIDNMSTDKNRVTYCDTKLQYKFVAFNLVIK